MREPVEFEIKVGRRYDAVAELLLDHRGVLTITIS
jgi:hypothetical protein